jgi:hypothetical protein
MPMQIIRPKEMSTNRARDKCDFIVYRFNVSFHVLLTSKIL